MNEIRSRNPERLGEEEIKALSLAVYLGCSIYDIELSDYGVWEFEVDNEEYQVLFDNQANTEWDNYLDNYIEECVLYEIPEHLQFYFDEELWKRDARYDGRGHSLSGYDGQEDYVDIVNGWHGEFEVYIYRKN